MIQGGNFSTFSINFYGTYERGLVITDAIMACDLSIQCVFSLTKNYNDGNNKNQFWALCEKNTAPGTELSRIVCAGIGPLQLGVVFVSKRLSSVADLNPQTKLARQFTMCVL